jgi:hypothetical protein
MLVREAIQAAGGHEEKTEGDGIFAVFGRVDQGVAAAVDAQRRLAAEPWPEGVAINVRMGLHTGDGALDSDGEYVGADVHRAARVSGAGHGGQILLSETSSSLVFDELPEGTELRSLGEHRLKDLRPEKICQLTVAGLRTEFPPIRSLDSRPNNLPTQLTSFVGREAELAEAGRLLESTRLLTLTGTGATATRAPFAGNIIPQTRWDPVTAAVVKEYPVSNIAGRDNLTDNYYYSPTDKNDSDQYDFRGDHNISEKHRFFARYSLRDQFRDEAGILPYPATGGLGQTVGLKGHNIASALSSSLTPTTSCLKTCART